MPEKISYFLDLTRCARAQSSGMGDLKREQKEKSDFQEEKSKFRRFRTTIKIVAGLDHADAFFIHLADIGKLILR